MVQLYLSTPEFDPCGNNDVVKERISLLHRLESILWSLITSGGRYEARLWFCNTISCVHTIRPRDQCDLFIDLLKSKKPYKDVAEQILRLVFEKRPEKVGPIIAKKSYMLEKFFGGNSGQILRWFDNFSSMSESGHKKGAKAIAQYAFVNRDICWEELEWMGKHGQSPAVVATKPYYFHDLDVLRTVENFLESVPEFWSSDELAESVKDGELDELQGWIHCFRSEISRSCLYCRSKLYLCWLICASSWQQRISSLGGRLQVVDALDCKLQLRIMQKII